MSTTKMKAGRLVAAYVDDALGRRLVLGQERESGLSIERVLLVGTTQAEVRETIAALRQLAEELPPGQRTDSAITKDGGR